MGYDCLRRLNGLLNVTHKVAVENFLQCSEIWK